MDVGCLWMVLSLVVGQPSLHSFLFVGLYLSLTGYHITLKLVISNPCSSHQHGEPGHILWRLARSRCEFFTAAHLLVCSAPHSVVGGGNGI
jgi:hypothetical protein